MSFDTIPDELKRYNQWCVWRLETKENTDKPTKVPYQPNGQKASVTGKSTWVDFETAIRACPIPNYTTVHDCNSSPLQTGFSGIGFVLTANDPYGFIDLDDCHDDAASYERQVKIYREFDTYAEHSPSGSGLHLIVKGNIPDGRRRSHIEVYSSERYMTMTGQTYNDREVMDRNGLLNILHGEMGAPPINYTYGQDQVEKEPDEVILNTAAKALNGEKFSLLFEGKWDDLYPSQSEADFALIDILAFYTQNRFQISRIFKLSALGERSKAKRVGYINAMIDRSFDRQLPPIDIDGLRIKNELAFKANNPTGSCETIGLSAELLAAPSTASDGDQEDIVSFPPGLVGEIAEFLYAAAPRPVRLIALAGAIGFLAGIVGRSYNFSGSGINQYILCIAETGAGKDAIASGISRLMGMIKPSVPACSEFVGPGQIASYQALNKWLSKYPSFVSIIGEFGLKLKEMSNERASPNVTGILTLMMQLYTKSGKGQTIDATAYADSARNLPTLHSPSFSIIGESTPVRFYEVLDPKMVLDGLLPRFTIFEYFGRQPYTSKTHKDAKPTFSLVERLSALMAQCLGWQAANTVHEVPATKEAQELLDKFDVWTTDKNNATNSEISKNFWTRASLKVIKLSALLSVGINYINPVVTVNEVNYAINLVIKEIENLIDRFDDGDTGMAANNPLNEYKQAQVLSTIIAQWFAPHAKYHTKYKMTDQMQKDFVLPHTALQTRLFNEMCFKNDRYGATASMKKALQFFMDAGDIQEMSKAGAVAKYGTRGKLYVIINYDRFSVFAIEKTKQYKKKAAKEKAEAKANAK